MRLDGIEVKATIDGSQVAAAVGRWLSGKRGEQRTIYFEERVEGEGEIEDVFEGRRAARALFSSDQERFAEGCALAVRVVP
jgi:hypothetical protein